VGRGQEGRDKVKIKGMKGAGKDGET